MRRVWRENEREGGASTQFRSNAAKQEFSVHITNLPAKLDRFGLKGIFRRAGTVRDAYIPQRKRDRWGRRFGFVRFQRWQEARRSVQLLDNMQIRGYKVRVTIAKYSKGERSIPRNRETNGRSWIWKKKGSSEEEGNTEVRGLELETKEQGRNNLRVVKGEINEEFQVWLPYSLVCSTEKPRDLATLSNTILSGYGQCTRICALSGYRFILTFTSKEAMEEALKNHEELDLWFYDIKRWDKYDRCESRKVWLEVIGIPPHGWKWQNFRKIAELWGHLICLGRSIEKTDTFETMTMLIQTNILRRIEDEIIFHIEDLGFRIVVKELSLVSPVLLKAHNFFHVQQDEDAASNEGVPGFEDVESGSEADSGMVQTARMNEDISNHNLEQKNPDHVLKRTQAELITNSNSNKEVEVEQSEEAARNASMNTDSRTKTAIFSQNEGSVGVLNRVLASRSIMLNDNAGQSIEESMTEPPGFERRDVLTQDPSKSIKVNADNCIAKFNSNNESVEVQEASGENREPRTHNTNDGAEKIHAENKLNKVKGAQQTSSSSTEGSVQRIAKEIERIGNILGLKVVQNGKLIAKEDKRLKTTNKLAHRDRKSKCGPGTQQ